MADDDAQLPGGLSRPRHLDLRGRSHQPFGRRIVVVVLSVVVVLALLNVVGQQPTTSRAVTSDAALTVEVPARVRGGLFFQGRIDIVARRTLEHPTLRLAPGWTEQLQVNTIEPAPTSETSRDGRLELEFDRLAAGERLTVWMQFEVNPEGPGRREQSVELLDRERQVASVDRMITVFP